MALQFASYSPTVPMAEAWTEALTVCQDDNGEVPMDITGQHVRAQFRMSNDTLFPGGHPPDPLFEFTTPGYYDAMPAWPVLEVFSIPVGTDGNITLSALRAQYVPLVSPTNVKTKIYWQVLLVDKATGFAEGLVEGRPVFIPATTA